MRKVLIPLLVLCLLAGCALPGTQPEQQFYDATFLTLFDTVTTVKGPAQSKEAFSAVSQAIHDELLRYHQLFDIYNDYEGIHNLKTVNDRAGIAPVKVDRAIIDLLTDCREYYEVTGGRVNVAMGSVLALWHTARNDGINDIQNAYLPDREALEEAAKHCSFDSIVIDEEASTVYISDPDTQLDVGAVAKGWAAQKVAEQAPKGILLSVGGNVCATGPKTETTPWVIGIQDPDNSSEYLHTLYVRGGSVVTSGDYQRTYLGEGKLYHHIIDPDTLMPGEYWRSVTILCGDSGLADALSTALFLMDREAGQALLDRYGAEALWVDSQGNCFYSPKFKENIRT